MAKCTRSAAFRKIDVDEYNEDNYKDDEVGESSVLPAGLDESEITGLLNSGKAVDALRLCLRSAPLGSKNSAMKEAALGLTLRALLAIKSSQMEEVVASLDPDSVDTLMKYIYRGFEMPSDGSSAHLLSWHEKVFAVGGIGSITRVLTDKKRV